MRKYLFIAVVLLAFVMVVTPAQARQFKTSQSGTSDEAWTQVKVQQGYTTIVSKGHVLCVSSDSATTTLNDGFLVELANASTDEGVLGVAQADIATGDTAMILCGGRGVIRVNEKTVAFSSQDTLGVHTSGDVTNVTTTSHLGKARIATALEASTNVSASLGYVYVHF